MRYKRYSKSDYTNCDHSNCIFARYKCTIVIKDSDGIINELASLHTSILNRDFCWDYKSKLCCDLMGVNSICKAYGDILDCIQDILDKHEGDTNDKYEQHK